MLYTTILGAAALLTLPVAQAAGGFYPDNTKVLQVNAKNYDKLIANSKHISIVEFYAPWCGHCKNLKVPYEKAANRLDGLANVAAIDCDDDKNKAFCGTMGVQGFPTLKIVKPATKKGGKATVVDYQGQRSAKAIVDAVADAIPNHITRISDKKTADKFFAEKGPKALLFTEKGTTSATLRTVAIDLLDSFSVGQVRNKVTEVVESFEITEFPTLLYIPADNDVEMIRYEGEMKKGAMVEFLLQASGQVEAEQGEKSESKTGEKVEADSSSLPKPLPIAHIPKDVAKECLDVRSHTCLLQIMGASSDTPVAYETLSKINWRYKNGEHGIFPMWAIAPQNPINDHLRTSLHLDREAEVIAVAGRRGWWKRYEGTDYTDEGLGAWVDEIRMGEGSKLKMPEGVFAATMSDEDNDEYDAFMQEQEKKAKAKAEGEGKPEPEAAAVNDEEKLAPHDEL